MTVAPYFDDVAEGPDAWVTTWARTADDVRIRLGFWPYPQARGTIVMFPGRTEYIEKYARLARDWAEAGFASAAIDWRGQGLSDRLGSDDLQHHVGRFLDYQRDIAEFLSFLKRQGAPEPFHLFAHSMGGAIALRALVEGWRPAGAVFSAPMWGIHLTPVQAVMAHALPSLAVRLGRGMTWVPGGERISHIIATTWAENKLTHDADHYEWFVRQLETHPELQLAAPSMQWFGQAMGELTRLGGARLPEVPALAFVGDGEGIVSPAAIRRTIARWPGGKLIELPGARHEIFMEVPEVRSRAIEAALSHWADATVPA